MKPRPKRRVRWHILVLDVGTTGVKAFVFDNDLNVVSRVYKPLRKRFPKKGWVEQNPQELLSVSKNALREAVTRSKMSRQSLVGLGITNQRETTTLWDTKTGNAVYPALVWEDTRTHRLCAGLKKQYGKDVWQKTGLTVDPYFSASKIRWVLTHIPKTEALLKENRLASGTVDSWILWNFAEGAPHLTDHTNASRTLLFNIKTLRWDNTLLGIFEIPKSILPRVLPSCSRFGALRKEILGFPLPILAVCGDQQASMYAAGTAQGATKITYGTGTFIMQALGSRFELHKDFFTTLVPKRGLHPWYAAEAKIAGTGNAVERTLTNSRALDTLLKKLALRVDHYIKKLPAAPRELVIDGGITRDKHLIELQSHVSRVPVRTQKIFDGTALGAAILVRESARVHASPPPAQ